MDFGTTPIGSDTTPFAISFPSTFVEGWHDQGWDLGPPYHFEDEHDAAEQATIFSLDQAWIFDSQTEIPE